MYAKPRAAGVLAKTDGMLWKMDRSAFRRLQVSREWVWRGCEMTVLW